MKVRILNWSRFNEKRKDVKHPSWFRMEHSLPLSQSLFGLTASERYVFIVLLCLASEKQSDTLDVDPEWVCFRGGNCFDRATLERTLMLLDGKTLEVVDPSGERLSCAAPSRDEDVTYADRKPPATRQTDMTDITGQDETDTCDSVAPPPDDPPDPPDLAELWNANRGALPECQVVTEKRRKAWKARWRELSDAEAWGAVIRRLAASPFCQGQNDRGWVATVDFLIQPETRVKTMEGKYDPVPARGPRGGFSTRERAVSEANKALWDKVERGEA